MKIDINLQGLDKVKATLATLSGDQARVAYAKALNDTAFQVRREMQAEMQRAFDRPTPFILRSSKVIMATSDNLQAIIAPTYRSDLGTKGGKIGVDPQQVLLAQEQGGRRRDKRSEVILRRVGILPQGYQTAIPASPLPGSDDGRGNLRGPFIAQLISYLQAFGEVGFKANMTDKRKKALQRGSAKAAGRRYFVSYGKLRGTHLAPGIWAAMGPGGVDVRPVVMFVKMGRYTPRISMSRIADAANYQDYLARRMRFRIREAAGV